MSDYILVSGTTKKITSYTGGSRYVVESGGVLAISSGGTLQWSDSTDHYILYGGKVYVCSGGTACGGTYLVSGSCYVYAGGIASSPEISDSSWFVVSSGGMVYHAHVSSGGIMDVKSSGFAYYTTVSGGVMRVDHYASKTEVYSGGIVRVGSGATLIDTTVNRDGAVTVSSGGTALSTYIYPGASAALYGIAYYNHISRGMMRIMSGGYANTNDVKNGVLNVSSGGTVTSNLISSGGSMNVDKGGLVSKTTIFTSGSAYIGGTASGTVMSGGSLDMFGSSYNGVYSAGVVSIGYGGYSYNEVFSNTMTYVTSSGSASGVVSGGTLGSGCMVIIRGGRFGGTTVSNAVFDLKGGNADVSGVKGASAWISGGVFYASGGGEMNSATVEPSSGAMGKMYVFSGTTVTKVFVSPNGHLGIMAGGFVTSADAKPNSGGSSATIGVSGGGSLGSAFVSGGRLDVGSGGVVRAAYLSMGGLGVVNGTVFSANVESGCPLQVSSGGIVSSAAISSGGRINLNQGKLGSAYVAKGGILSVNSGGSVGSGNVYGSAVVSYGVATGLSVQSGGRLTISNWGGVSRCTVYGGTVDIHSAGSFVSCAVSQGGSVTVNRGAFVIRGTVGSGGVVKVSSGVEWFNSYTVLNGGKVTGYYDCKGITFSSGGIADFNIFNISSSNPKPVIKNISYAKNRGVVFTLTVSLLQANDLYVLADDAAGFNETVTVQNIYGDKLGTLTVGQTANIGGVNYRLDLDSDILSVSVGVAAPAAAKGDIDGNGVSDVLFQFTGGDYQLGYWMNGTNTWRGQGLAKPAEWEVLGSYDMNNNGKADSVLVGNVTTEIGGKGAYIGYYLDSVDKDTNWVNIGYLNNEENIAWKNKVGNLTGNTGMNSIVWYAPELYALGVWTDGTTDWLTLSNTFGGKDWTLIGCGDFDGNGKDSVVMSYNNGQLIYAAGINESTKALGSANWSGWEIRAIGDFAGDGKDDIVLFHEDTGSMVMCANGNIDNYVSIGQLAPKDWFVVGAGDYNGDAKDDLLVRQYSTGMLGYYSGGDQSQWVEMGRGVDMKWTVIA